MYLENTNNDASYLDTFSDADNYSYSESFEFNSIEENMPMLSDRYSPGSSITNSSNILERDSLSEKSKKIKQQHLNILT
jgi:hypothetical protein